MTLKYSIITIGLLVPILYLPFLVDLPLQKARGRVFKICVFSVVTLRTSWGSKCLIFTFQIYIWRRGKSAWLVCKRWSQTYEKTASNFQGIKLLGWSLNMTLFFFIQPYLQWQSKVVLISGHDWDFWESLESLGYACALGFDHIAVWDLKILRGVTIYNIHQQAYLTLKDTIQQ